MKVHEIISENKTNEVIGAGIRAIGRGAASAMRAPWGKKVDAFSRGRRAFTIVNAKKAMEKSIAAEKLKMKANDIVSLLTTLNIVQEGITYWVKSYDLDPNKPEDKEQLTKLRGEFVVGALGPKLAVYLGSKTGVNWLLGLLPRFAGAVGFKSLEALAKPAAVAALTAFFATSAGKEVVNNLFGGYLTAGAGMIVNALEELVKATIETGGDLAQAARDVAQGKVDQVLGPSMSFEPVADPKGAIRIDGQLVTNPDGTLMNTADIIANRRVQLARSQSIAAGKGDPLAAIPRKPGQPLPPLD